MFKKKTNPNPLHKSELLFKDCESLVLLVSLDCNRMPEQVDHSLHPNGSHCYFKRADICWIGERGSFQRNDESPVLDCSERGPHEWMRTWQKRVEGKSAFKQQKKKQQTPISSSISPSSHTLYFRSLYSHFSLCTSLPAVSTILIFVVNADQSNFWEGVQRRHMYLAAAAEFVTIDLIVQLCV